MNVLRLFFLPVILLSILSGIRLVYATPIIGIGSMYDVLTPNLKSMTKRIYNTGNSTAFVRVELLEVNPENGNEVVQNELSGTQPERNRLIVTPQRLIIAPAGFQSVRIIWPGERINERYFRLRFTPVIPEENDSFGLDNKSINEYQKNTLNAGLNVLTGYGSLVILQPNKPSFKTSIDNSEANKIKIKNDGDTTVVLENIRLCKAANTDCSAVTRDFILPKRQRILETKKGFKTSFTLIEGDNDKAYTF